MGHGRHFSHPAVISKDEDSPRPPDMGFAGLGLFNELTQFNDFWQVVGLYGYLFYYRFYNRSNLWSIGLIYLL